jgi:hypothetical protein
VPPLISMTLPTQRLSSVPRGGRFRRIAGRFQPFRCTDSAVPLDAFSRIQWTLSAELHSNNPEESSKLEEVRRAVDCGKVMACEPSGTLNYVTTNHYDQLNR